MDAAAADEVRQGRSVSTAEKNNNVDRMSQARYTRKAYVGYDNVVKSRVVFSYEIEKYCRQAGRQTDRQTDICTLF